MGRLKVAFQVRAGLACRLRVKGSKKWAFPALEHVTIRCAQLQRTRDFYVDLMGLTEGERPDFPFRGHWLYLGGIPVVHLVEATDTAGAWGREFVHPRGRRWHRRLRPCRLPGR